MAVAQQILTSLEQPLALQDQTVDLSAGIGIACWPGDAEDADMLLSQLRNRHVCRQAQAQRSVALRRCD